MSLPCEILSTEFLSTPSARRATIYYSTGAKSPCISIHALREEGDKRQTRQYNQKHISIHALREEGDSSIEKECKK